MTQHGESGHDRTERKEHDRKARHYESTTSNPYHLSRTGRTAVVVLIVFVVVALTWLLAFGGLHF
jgi:hypothetical protein